MSTDDRSPYHLELGVYEVGGTGAYAFLEEPAKEGVQTILVPERDETGITLVPGICPVTFDLFEKRNGWLEDVDPEQAKAAFNAAKVANRFIVNSNEAYADGAYITSGGTVHVTPPELDDTAIKIIENWSKWKRDGTSLETAGKDIFPDSYDPADAMKKRIRRLGLRKRP